MSSQLLSHGSISGVRFQLASSESIKNESFVQIKTHDLFRGNVPYPGGVCDAHTGTTDHSYRCQTCHNTKRECLGHSGHIALNYPVWNPLGVSEARRWLRLICFECGKPCIPASMYKHFDAKVRLDEASKIARTTNRKCWNCDTVHPIIKKNKESSEHLALNKIIMADKTILSNEPIYPHEVGKILSKISDETVVEMGRSVRSHAAKSLILHNIRVPSTPIRPDVKKIGGGRSTNDDLTTMLQILVKRNDALPPVVPAFIDPKTEKAIYELNNAYYDFVRASGESAMNSVASRLKGKTGRFRKNQMGKRVRVMCRGTIMGDTRLRIDEVGIPLIFATTVQIEEIVQENNKKRLMGYVLNGTKQYPGASRIIDRATGQELVVDNLVDPHLNVGDIVLRDIIDGDVVNFNRQPSLKPSNIAAHFAKVILDPSFKGLSMNVLSCVLYNADFDGDQMNLIISAGTETRNEISQLSSVSNWFVSQAYSSPSIGQADDSVIGTAELTRSGVNFDKFHAMKLFQSASSLPDFSDMELGSTISGRECVSKVLVRTPINFSRTAMWYDPAKSAFIKYDPTEIRVEINQGKLVSGILDKKSIGKDANGGIYHIIANEYGAQAALTCIFDMQQLAIANTLMSGYTIGIMDLMINADAKREIDEISADIINKSRIITEELQNGEIVPPIGKTVESFFEERQINTLNIFDDFVDPILRSINPQTNNLFKLIAFGSKGKMSNMYSMMSAGGQKLINGERIRPKFGFKRTLAYFPRFDTSPESRGFITNSFLSGMTSSEYIFDAMAARFDLISKALSTSITGEQNRKSIKNLESIIVSNHRWCLKHTNVIQFAYGEDFLDPRKVELVEFPTVMISTATFEQRYRHEQFEGFFATMKADREKYRKIFLRVEDMNIKEMISDRRRMPVDVARVIKDICREFSDALAEPSAETLSSMVQTVEHLCTGIPYVLINEIQERLKSDIPDYIKAACWLLTMLIRSYLHPGALVAAKITPKILDLIIAKIRVVYARALVEPGTAVGIIAAMSFSEPLTQYMLDAHHRSASGGTSKSTVVKTKEILGARDTSKLVNPSMLIPVLPEFATSEAKVQEIANGIEMMKFRRFVRSWQIFAEKYGEPVHSKYAHEQAMIAEFAKLNPIISPPGDLVRWCIRFSIDKTTMILKNMTMELLIRRIREVFPDMYVIYSAENAAESVVRVYMRMTMFKGAVTTNLVREYKDRIAETIIRGVDGITTATATMMLRNKISEDGSIVRDDRRWGITTIGTNLVGILAHPNLDHARVITDAIQEIYSVYGIEAARQAIISGMRGLIDSINHRHYLIYADEMTFTGRVTSIESTGLKTREASNILLRIGFTSPLGTIEEASITAAYDSVTGVTAPLLVGTCPKIGTIYNTFQVNPDFVKTQVKKADDVLMAGLTD